MTRTITIAGRPVLVRVEETESPFPESRHCAYDDNRYDGAPDAGVQIVGYGETADAAVADLIEQLEEEADVE